MDISKLFGGNREKVRPISSNRHKKIRYIYQDLEKRLGKDTADQIMTVSDRKYLYLQKQYSNLPPAVKQHTDLIFMVPSETVQQSPARSKTAYRFDLYECSTVYVHL